MRYLIDTQTLLWALEDNPNLSQQSKSILEDTTSVLYVSIASLWEIAIKTSIKKLELRQSLAQIVQILPQMEVLVLPIDPVHILTVETLPFFHRDPFDRIIIAQALAENLEIISSDGIFRQYPVTVHW
jgi:PIN domain nuclease of toxin-antitoxin system